MPGILVRREETQKEGDVKIHREGPGDHRGRDWGYGAASQGLLATSRSWEEIRKRFFPSVFREERTALPTPWFQTSNLQTVGTYISIALSHLFWGPLLWQTQETNRASFNLAAPFVGKAETPAMALKYISSCQECCSPSRGLSFPSLQLMLYGPPSVSPFPESILVEGKQSRKSIANVPLLLHFTSASPMAQTVKSPPIMQQTQVWFMGHEDPLEKGMAMHFSIFAWRLSWTEEPAGLQSMGSHRVRHDWVTNTVTFTRGLPKSKPPPKSPSRLGM